MLTCPCCYTDSKETASLTTGKEIGLVDRQRVDFKLVHLKWLLSSLHVGVNSFLGMFKKANKDLVLADSILLQLCRNSFLFCFVFVSSSSCSSFLLLYFVFNFRGRYLFLVPNTAHLYSVLKQKQFKRRFPSAKDQNKAIIMCRAQCCVSLLFCIFRNLKEEDEYLDNILSWRI